MYICIRIRIPPALWATGGLEAPLPKNPSSDPSSLWGGVLTPSLPLPVDPGRADLGSPDRPLARQSPSKSHPKITQLFHRNLNPFWRHFGFQNGSPKHPKTSQNQQKVSPSMKKTNF